MGIKHLSKLTRLESLDLTCCPAIQGVLQEAGSKVKLCIISMHKTRGHTTSLIACFFEYFVKTGLEEGVLSQLVNLKSLDASSCTFSSLDKLPLLSKTLQHLSIANCG